MTRAALLLCALMLAAGTASALQEPLREEREVCWTDGGEEVLCVRTSTVADACLRTASETLGACDHPAPAEGDLGCAVVDASRPLVDEYRPLPWLDAALCLGDPAAGRADCVGWTVSDSRERVCGRSFAVSFLTAREHCAWSGFKGRTNLACARMPTADLMRGLLA